MERELVFQLSAAEEGVRVTFNYIVAARCSRRFQNVGQAALKDQDDCVTVTQQFSPNPFLLNSTSRNTGKVQIHGKNVK